MAHTLVLVPAVCGIDAYNYFSTALIAPNAGSLMTRVRFDAPNGIEGETVTDAPAWSMRPTIKELSSYRPFARDAASKIAE